jgi:alpha-glucosidase
MDGNGDGVGDFIGMAKRLDYLKGTPTSLGIDAVWVSPFYKSPMADFGYDVSDYYSVDPLFGTMEDFRHFLSEAHDRNIKVMIDYVPNHTSDQHPWFQTSRSSPNNEKRDWYIWHDPAPDGGPPNNWSSVFGDSAWELDATTGQYYLHSFLAQQPDLNWENPAVREAMRDVLDFWLTMGVDGIRADAVRWMSKDYTFRDNPPNPNYKEGDDPYNKYYTRYSRYGDKLFDYLKEIAQTVEKYPDRIILFEDYLDTTIDKHEQYSHFYSVDRGVAAPFNFEGIHLPYDAAAFRLLINQFQMLMQGELRPFYCFGNHDQSRLVTRVGVAQARLIAMLQLTLPGIPVVYYGDELGMQDVSIAPDKVQDPFEKQEPGLGLGRDPERTPMQWSTEQNAGFSKVQPWLPVANNFTTVNVEVETRDSNSSFVLYRTLLALRHAPAIKTGKYVEWEAADDTVFGFSRESDDETLFIILNMSDKAVERLVDMRGALIFSTHAAVQTTAGGILLQPHQGIVMRRK